jgi:hypothetical protein
VSGNEVRLSWTPEPSRSADVFYRILRGPGTAGGLGCAGRLHGSADQCRVYADSPGVARGRSFVDHPGSGTWTYRIGVSANWLDDVAYGDITVLSPPVTVTVP